MFHTLVCNRVGRSRSATLEGRNHIVVPMTMITVGVHNGSHGALYYPEQVLKSSIQLWNHVPVLVDHPAFGSAATERVLNAQKIGIVLNTKLKDGRLTADAYLEESRMNAIDARVTNALKERKTMEVSTGLYSTVKKEEGTWNGKPYTAIVTEIRPDHLAVLPDTKGACSLDDGCGLAVANCACGKCGGKLSEDERLELISNLLGVKNMTMPKESMLGRPTMNFGKEEKKDEGPKVIPHPTLNETPLGRPSLDIEPDVPIKRPGVRGEEPLGRPKLTF